VSVRVPKTIEDEIASLGLSADLRRGVYVCLRGEVARRCDGGTWPPLVGSVRDLTFNQTELCETSGMRWHYFTFYLEEVPCADGRQFEVLEVHYHCDE